MVRDGRLMRMREARERLQMGDLLTCKLGQHSMSRGAGRLFPLTVSSIVGLQQWIGCVAELILLSASR